MRETSFAQALDHQVRTAASAGGAATGVLVSALKRGDIDAALVIGRDPARPWVPAATFATTADEIIACAQASYCIAPNLQLLKDAPFERIAVVGVPCQIQAINKMRNLEEPPSVVGRIVFTMEVACSSSTKREGTEYLIEERLQLPLVDVTDMKYRAGEYPGQFTVWDRDGEKRRLPFHELVTEFKNFKTFRCLACPDWWSGLADISVADGDPNIFRTSREAAPAEKTSLVVTRTERGQQFIAAAVEHGDLRVTAATFEPEESLGLQRKRHRYARYAKKHAGRVPLAPVQEELTVPLEDDDVIDSMSTIR